MEVTPSRVVAVPPHSLTHSLAHYLLHCTFPELCIAKLPGERYQSPSRAEQSRVVSSKDVAEVQKEDAESCGN